MSTVSQGKKHRDCEDYLCLDEHHCQLLNITGSFIQLRICFPFSPPNVVFSTAFYSVTFEVGFRKVGNNSLQWDGREKQCSQATDWNMTTKGWSQQEKKKISSINISSSTLWFYNISGVVEIPDVLQKRKQCASDQRLMRLHAQKDLTLHR